MAELLSAQSGDLLGNGQMLVMRTSENPAYPICKLVSSKLSLGLCNLAFGVNPLGLYSVKPQTPLWQKTAYEPHSFTTLFDPAVVLAEPAPELLPELFGDVPGSVLPDENHDLLAKRLGGLGSSPDFSVVSSKRAPLLSAP